jgi:hypothetical protein
MIDFCKSPDIIASGYDSDRNETLEVCKTTSKYCT